MKRELNVPEIAAIQAYEPSRVCGGIGRDQVSRVSARLVMSRGERVRILGRALHPSVAANVVDSTDAPRDGLHFDVASRWKLCGQLGSTRNPSVVWAPNKTGRCACTPLVLKGSHAMSVASVFWCARPHTTRLETRTKESIHVCEYTSETTSMRNESIRRDMSTVDRPRSTESGLS